MGLGVVFWLHTILNSFIQNKQKNMHLNLVFYCEVPCKKQDTLNPNPNKLVGIFTSQIMFKRLAKKLIYSNLKQISSYAKALASYEKILLYLCPFIFHVLLLLSLLLTIL